MPTLTGPLHLGIDIGTSGVRAIAIDGQGTPAAQVARAMPTPSNDGGAIVQDPAIWWQTLDATLLTLRTSIDPGRITSIAVDGTSGTLLLADKAGR